MLTRRQLLGTAAAVAALPARAAEAPPTPWGFCLNTATIRGQKIGVEREAEVAAKAGYNGFEPWIDGLDEFVKAGGSLKDLGKKIADLGLSVESAIGFAEWIVEDRAKRAKGLDEAKRCCDMLKVIGGKRLAAPPAGATDVAGLDPFAVADRYRALAEVAAQFEIAPEVEIWGFSRPLKRLSEVVFVAVQSAHPKACVLPDIYHLYKGGSDPAGLRLLSGASIGIFHMNDYPKSLSPEAIGDADRVMPGDGDAPLAATLKVLRAIGYAGMLSLELFNRDYWKRDALEVARLGLAKLKAVTGR